MGAILNSARVWLAGHAGIVLAPAFVLASHAAGSIPAVLAVAALAAVFVADAHSGAN